MSLESELDALYPDGAPPKTSEECRAEADVWERYGYLRMAAVLREAAAEAEGN